MNYAKLDLHCANHHGRPSSSFSLRVHTVTYYEYGKEIESEHEKVVRVPCFIPILAVPCEMQSIRAHTVDLSPEAITALFGSQDVCVELLEVPEDLRELKAEVRDLTLTAALRTMQECLSEFVHLETLRLDGTMAGEGESLNLVLRELPSSLGDLPAMKSLTLIHLDALEALPASIGRLTSLETLHIEYCDVLQALPTMELMTSLTLLTVNNGDWKELPASLGDLPALKTLSLLNFETLEAFWHQSGG